MIAALGTVVFLLTLLAIAAVAAVLIEQSGGKVVAALKGQSLLATRRQAAPAPVRISSRARSQRAVRAEARWRAAA